MSLLRAFGLGTLASSASRPTTRPAMRLSLLTSTGVVLTVLAQSRASEPSRDGVDIFEKPIRPVLVERCYSCHSASADKVRGGLLLDTADAVRKGGDSGPTIVPGKPADSRIIK